MGDNTIHYMGHVKMMGAVQPFITGAISKTVNMPEEATVEDVEQLHIEAWKLGLKAVAIYRDNCKVAQPLSTQKKAGASDALEQQVERIVETVIVQEPVRQKLPRTRNSKTFSFRVADCHGYATVGEFEDGRPGRGVPQGGEAGLDARRHHGRVRDLGEPRPAVRRAARGVRRDVHEHALRAGGHDRRPRHPVRHEPRRLHLPPPRGGVPDARGAHGDGRAHGERAAPADAARRRGGHDARRRPGSTLLPLEDRPPSAVMRRRRGRRIGPMHGAEGETVLCYVCGDIMQRAGSCHACPAAAPPAAARDAP